MRVCWRLQRVRRRADCRRQRCPLLVLTELPGDQGVAIKWLRGRLVRQAVLGEGGSVACVCSAGGKRKPHISARTAHTRIGVAHGLLKRGLQCWLAARRATTQQQQAGGSKQRQQQRRRPPPCRHHGPQQLDGLALACGSTAPAGCSSGVAGGRQQRRLLMAAATRSSKRSLFQQQQRHRHGQL